MFMLFLIWSEICVAVAEDWTKVPFHAGFTFHSFKEISWEDGNMSALRLEVFVLYCTLQDGDTA